MLSFKDERWTKLLGGYRMPFDPRPSLHNLESNVHAKEAWHELWEELHHQGDVGGLLTPLCRIWCGSMASGKGKNPEVPEWLKEEYFSAIQDLAKLASTEILRAKDPEDVRAILSIIALAKRARTHARFLLEYSEEEMIAFERQVQETDS